ncbi:hypothetical protein BZA77DRAFT_313457 [Pyronema omphalodes]|nr:hypothetical protein BZA77DRAFT_313457 [Pyronema omphalodes]
MVYHALHKSVRGLACVFGFAIWFAVRFAHCAASLRPFASVNPPIAIIALVYGTPVYYSVDQFNVIASF